MKSLSSVGLGLSVVFGCLFFALVAEIYYLLWWKRRVEDDYYNNPAREFFYIFCWKTKKRRPENPASCQNKDLSKPIDDNFWLMVGPSRFLYTIEEERNEDLESGDGNSGGECNNGDNNTPFLTPLSSPAFFTPPLTPSMGYNPLYEACTDFEFNKIRASPPSNLKFLRDAEEKLQKKVILNS